jgi:hypothetical protein
VINQRAAASEQGDSTAQAQRHAQRLAIERLRRAVADLTLEVRGVHGRLDRMEALLRQVAGAPPAIRDGAEGTGALAAAIAAHDETTQTLAGIEQTTLPAMTELTTTLSEPASAEAAEDTIEAQPTIEAETNVRPQANVARESSTEAERPRAQRAPASASPPRETAPQTDARAAVEAAVASALQEARRAASESAAPRAEQPAPAAPRATQESEAPASIAAQPEDERPLTWSPRETFAEAPLESPRAVLGATEDAQAGLEQTFATEEQRAADVERAPRPMTPPAAPTAAAAEEQAAAPRPGLWVPPSAVAPPRAVPAQPAPAPSEAPAPTASSMAPSSMERTASMEPQPAGARAMAQAAAPARPMAPERALERAPQPATEPMARPDLEERGVFFPDGGPVILRIAPISGFQGLMRVQDSVVQLAAVREATVEAYARGEARLRLQLIAALEPDVLSESLTSSLGTRAGLQSVSDEERSIQIALG